MFAAYHNHSVIVELLLENQANPDVANSVS